MLRYAEGEPTRLPYRIARQVIAARYGQSPADVDTWPADDFLDALGSLGVTAPPQVRFGK